MQENLDSASISTAMLRSFDIVEVNEARKELFTHKNQEAQKISHQHNNTGAAHQRGAEWQPVYGLHFQKQEVHALN